MSDVYSSRKKWKLRGDSSWADAVGLPTSHPFLSFLVTTSWPKSQGSAPAFICWELSLAFGAPKVIYGIRPEMPGKGCPPWVAINQWVVEGGRQVIQLLHPSVGQYWGLYSKLLPEVPSRTEFQLSTVVTCLTHSVPAACLPSLTFHPLLRRSPGITSRINYLSEMGSSSNQLKEADC